MVKGALRQNSIVHRIHFMCHCQYMYGTFYSVLIFLLMLLFVAFHILFANALEPQVALTEPDTNWSKMTPGNQSKINIFKYNTCQELFPKLNYYYEQFAVFPGSENDTQKTESFKMETFIIFPVFFLSGSDQKSIESDRSMGCLQQKFH